MNRRRPTTRASAFLAWAVIFVSSSAPLASVEDVKASESVLKAAYFSKLANFVEWPRGRLSEGPPIRLCVLGDHPFGEALDAIERQKAHGLAQTLVLLRDLEDASSCHALFIGADRISDLDEILRGLEGASVLTVGETRAFARAGGMVGFVFRSGRLRMEINLNAAERAGLEISAKLLELSQIVGPRRSG